MIVIEKWQGLVTNASPYTIPPGSAVTQVNLQVISPGQVSVRPGTTSLSFSTHSSTNLKIVRMFRYQSQSEVVIYQNDSGQIRAGTL
jgi:hypothetical protein